MLLLHVVVAIAAAWTVALTPNAPPRADLALLSIMGLALGYILARLRPPDLAAHLLAITLGLIASAWLASDVMSSGGVRNRLGAVGAAAIEWYSAVLSGKRIADPSLFAVILGLTVFLVAYTSAWTLYRRGWLATALFLPGVIAFVTLGLDGTTDTLPLVILIAAGCVMAARYHVYRRSQAWARAGLTAPNRLPQRFLWAGVALALIAAILGWTMPISSREGLGQVWAHVEEPWSQVQQQWDDLLAKMAGVSNLSGGSYASFGDEFRLGGALNLSDEPVMVYRPVSVSAGPTYLAGHRYDNYNGHGWSTRVDDTFTSVNDDGQQFSAQMTFARGQGVHLSPDVTTDREEITGDLEAIRPKGDLLFTRDTFLSAGMQVNVQLSWRQLRDEPYPLLDADFSQIPLDLRQIATALQGAIFDPMAQSPTPSALDPLVAADIGAQIEQLRGRFLDVSWSVAPDGRADTMFVTGQVPVYDDVEAVFGNRPVTSGERYSIAGLASIASMDQLRGAPAAYPDWVTARYLQLPDTITQRTRDLAAQVMAGATNPFDAAYATQQFLRGHITYNEKIAAPPRDRDVVDYVLFDSREGYCEYYGSAMAVMLRSQGIPARVVGGYYPAPWDDDRQGYLYREKNAHLWVEVFFPGFGWIPFEPTSSQNPIPYGDAAMGDKPEPTPTPTPEPTPTPVPDASPVSGQTGQPVAPDRPTPFLSQPGRALGWAAVVLAVLAALGATAAAGVWQWRLRGLSPAGGLYARAMQAGKFWGVQPEPNQTPREYAERFGEAVPAASGPARIVADLYSQDIYAGRTPDAPALDRARAAWAQLRRETLGGLLRRRDAGNGKGNGE